MGEGEEKGKWLEKEGPGIPLEASPLLDGLAALPKDLGEHAHKVVVAHPRKELALWHQNVPRVVFDELERLPNRLMEGNEGSGVSLYVGSS
jgi:hypothetical protein